HELLRAMNIVHGCNVSDIEQRSIIILNAVHKTVKTMLNKSKLLERRQNLREILLNLAEKTIAKTGVHSLRARPLADSAACAVGMIYQVFADLDELILAVNERTLETLDGVLEKAGQKPGPRP